MKSFLASCAALALCFSAFAAEAKGKPPAKPKAGTWTVGHGKGIGCFARGSLKSGAKFCHNCTSAGGTEVRWSFPLLCDGKATTKVSNVILACNGTEGDETAQQTKLQAKVNLSAKNPCPN